MSATDLKEIQQNFLKELQDANNGKKTSLAYIINQIPNSSLVKDGEIFQVLVIGGSVCKNAIISKKDIKLTVVKQTVFKQPSFKKALDFLEFIDKHLEKNVRCLAINFAYPLKPIFGNNKLDGILIRGAKENGFSGIVGKKVGDEIEKYIYQKNNKKILVSVANDTICLLLSGLIKYPWENLAAGIVGTGLNFAIFLDNKNLVNLESANFDKFPQTKEGKIIDKESSSPKKALFEKEVAGAYLYKHFNLIIKEKNLPHSPINSTEELNELATKNIPLISDISRNIISRSAQLVSSQIAGITAFKKCDLIFVMEGSLFWKGFNYKDIVQDSVKKLVPKYKVDFAEIKNSNILGAAKLIS